MKLPKELNTILSDKYVLYIVAFLAITNVIGYLAIQDFNSLLLFVLIGYLTAYFSKNMTVVLLSALVLTNLLMGARKLQAPVVREGMQGGETLPDEEEDTPESGNNITNEGGSAKKEIEQLEMKTSPKGMQQLGGMMSTKDIQAQQKLLKENLENIKPMLATAKEMMDTLKSAKGMFSQFGGLGGLLPGMGGGGEAAPEVSL